MRTKTLLIAAAALAATVISSQAQVYSGVVGYVNIVSPAGHYIAVANPLDLDGIDNVTNVLANAPKGTVVQIWNGAGYNLVSRATLGAGLWSASAATNFIPPGVGFFINTPSDFTNTYVGSVLPGTYPGTNTFALTAGKYAFVGSLLPISGTLTNAVDQGPDALNLGSVLPKGTVLQIWNGNGFTLVSRATLGAGNWSSNATINVGQAFFVNSPASTNWVQSLQ